MFPILLELIEEGNTNKQKVVLKFFVQSQLSAMLDRFNSYFQSEGYKYFQIYCWVRDPFSSKIPIP